VIWSRRVCGAVGGGCGAGGVRQVVSELLSVIDVGVVYEDGAASRCHRRRPWRRRRRRCWITRVATPFKLPACWSEANHVTE
jgi:hypothetical protein